MRTETLAFIATIALLGCDKNQFGGVSNVRRLTPMGGSQVAANSTAATPHADAKGATESSEAGNQAGATEDNPGSTEGSTPQVQGGDPGTKNQTVAPVPGADGGQQQVPVPPPPGAFGYGSWVEVRSCQSTWAMTAADLQACMGYLDNISNTRKVETCTDQDRIARSGGASCNEEGKLCRSGSDGRGARLWVCHRNNYDAANLRGSWSEIRNCQADYALGAAQGDSCKQYLESFGPAERCTDDERLNISGGAVCNKEGKVCRSGADGKGFRLWVCHLPTPLPLKAVGGWMEIRNCQADAATGAAQGQACQQYLDSLAPAAPGCTDQERLIFTNGGACDAAGKFCRSGGGARLFLCY